MSALGDVLDFLGLGPNSWDERLAKTIQLISPGGKEFSAYWRGSPRSVDKKLGIYLYPKVPGNVVDDLDVNSNRYSIQFFFEGKDNDKDAERLFNAAKERGTWTITHPVHGFVDLQLISLTELTEPITSGNITEFNSEWIEPIDPDTLKTARELAGLIDGQGDALGLSALQDFADNVREGTERLKDAIEQTTQAIGNLSENLLAPLAAVTDSIDSIFNAIQSGINDTLNATVLQVEALGGQIQALIQTPALGTNSLRERLDAYDNFAAESLQLLPGGDRSRQPAGISTDVVNNEIVTTEIALVSTISALATIAITTPVRPVPTATVTPETQVTTSDFIETRAQALEAAENITNIFNAIVAGLEIAQDAFSGNALDKQYFSQKTSYAEATILMGQTLEYLQTITYNLAIEKRFTLERPRTPVDITIQEYGSLGENDSNLDLFIRTNKLKGKEIILMPRGKEVVVYV